MNGIGGGMYVRGFDWWVGCVGCAGIGMSRLVIVCSRFWEMGVPGCGLEIRCLRRGS